MSEKIVALHKGYYKLHSISRSHSVKSDKDLVQLNFIHTEDPDMRGMAMLPAHKVSPEWPLETYLQFNEDFPEALDHLDELNKTIEYMYEQTKTNRAY